MNESKSSLWYDSLIKSSLNPPSIVFSIVWPILYFCILLSFIIYLFNKPTFLGITIFVLSFIVNLAWSYVFFSSEKIGFGLLVIVILWLSILAILWQTDSKSKISSLLIVPYLLWVTFALYLNFYIYIKN